MSNEEMNALESEMLDELGPAPEDDSTSNETDSFTDAAKRLHVNAREMMREYLISNLGEPAYSSTHLPINDNPGFEVNQKERAKKQEVEILESRVHVSRHQMMAVKSPGVHVERCVEEGMRNMAMEIARKHIQVEEMFDEDRDGRSFRLTLKLSK